MRQELGPVRAPAKQAVKDIRRATDRHFSAEDKIRVVLEAIDDRSPRPDRVWNRHAGA